jgi:hypothetical protein
VWITLWLLVEVVVDLLILVVAAQEVSELELDFL